MSYFVNINETLVDVSTLVAGMPLLDESDFPYKNFPSTEQKPLQTTWNEIGSISSTQRYTKYIWGMPLDDSITIPYYVNGKTTNWVRYTHAPWYSNSGIYISDTAEADKFYTMSYEFSQYWPCDYCVKVDFELTDDDYENGMGKLTCTLYQWNSSSSKWVSSTTLCRNKTFRKYALISLQGGGGPSLNDVGGGGGAFLQLAVDLWEGGTLYIRPMWHGTASSSSYGSSFSDSGDGYGLVLTSKPMGSTRLFHESQSPGTFGIYVPGGYSGGNGGGVSRTPTLRGFNLPYNRSDVTGWSQEVSDSLFNKVPGSSELNNNVSVLSMMRPVYIKQGGAGGRNGGRGQPVSTSYSFGSDSHKVFDVETGYSNLGGQIPIGGGASASGVGCGGWDGATKAGPGGGGCSNKGLPGNQTIFDSQFGFPGVPAFSIVSLK